MSSTSPTWMLPLLLLSLSSSFHPSSSESNKQTIAAAKICSMNEFNNIVKHLEVALKDKTCQCFNLSAPQGDPGISDYFIRGLKSLHLKQGRPQNIVRDLVKILTRKFQDFEINIDALKIKNENIISPKSFGKTLERLVQLINSKCALL